MKKVIHDKHYHRIQVLFESAEFNKIIRSIKKGFIELGCPLSTGGLKDEKEYDIWNEKFFDCRAKVKNKPEFLKEVLRNFLIDNKIDPEDKFYREALRAKLFFNKTEPETIPLYTIEKWNKKTKKPELYIQIFPHTTKQDISEAWDWIEKEKKITFKNIPQPKPWEGMKRDLAIHKLSESLKKISPNIRKELYGHRSANKIILERDQKENLGKLSPEIIRQALYKVKKYGNLL